MMIGALGRALITMLFLLSGGTVFASCSGTGDPRVLSVAVQHAPPFITLEDDAPESGLNIDLWNDVSAALIEQRIISSAKLVECNSVKEILDAVANGQVDMAIAPITITEQRLERVDFSQQFFLSGLTVAAPGDDGISFDRALETIVDVVLRPGTGQAVLFFLALNLALAVLIRYLLWDAKSPERQTGPIMSVISPFFEAIERTLGLKGLSDSTATAAGRVLEIFMALAGAALSAAIIGVLTTSFIAAIGEAEYIPPEDLPNLRVALIEGETADEFYQSRFAPEVGPPECGAATIEGTAGCIYVESLQDALNFVNQGTVDVALGDWAALSYHARQRRYRGRISVQPEVFRNEPLAWVLPIESDQPRPIDVDELRRAIDGVLISQMRLPTWRDTVELHLGIGAIAPD